MSDTALFIVGTFMFLILTSGILFSIYEVRRVEGRR